GFTNKLLGKVVHGVFLHFAETRRFFKAKKILMTGNPIRRDIRLALESRTGRPAAGSRPGGAFRVFAFGGSQGAQALNEVVADAAALLAARGVTLDIVHQTGQANLEKTQERYTRAGLAADVRAFITDMAAEYRRADLVIARAGATTVAELGVVGRPAILVPYPFAADNHQEVNAREMAEAGAAVMFRQSDLTAEILAAKVAALAADPDALARMSAAMRSLGKPRAAEAILDWCAAAG
ncbi:MAG TPA: UDP-N-acetylglucosamine--N-acetylmuramyl-(pentapeptide) pyrophosphoryl-undecaprenol N-acetylglucosamine transferase, partial [Kofleriaceae bacterium]|nr:UDP-N-acetylglucosamine--N-acetylmuramyl-(pentapeptide) pyrophosphoryl-undecaprenol N-acetylglucosamine transferase [Kofleriaceae bacterium]